MNYEVKTWDGRWKGNKKYNSNGNHQNREHTIVDCTIKLPNKDSNVVLFNDDVDGDDDVDNNGGYIDKIST